MRKTVRKSYYLVAVIALIIVLTSCLLLINNTNSYAGSWEAGALNYVGSSNRCEYAVVVSSNVANEHVFSAMGFKVQMVGKYAKKNSLTTFRYLVNFTLQRISPEDKYISTYNSDFKITDVNQITQDAYKPIVFESSCLSGVGTYRLTWDGEIKSNATEHVSGSYQFQVTY